MLPQRRLRQGPWPPLRRHRRAYRQQAGPRRPLALSAAQLIILYLLLRLAPSSLATPTSALSTAARSAGAQFQASINAPFTCDPTGVNWGLLSGAEQPSTTITCTNHGRWPLHLQTYTQGQASVIVTPESVTLSSGASQSITATVDTASPGSYSGLIVIEGHGQSMAIPVDYQIQPPAPTAAATDASVPTAPPAPEGAAPPAPAPASQPVDASQK